MTLIELSLIGLSLAMDAFALSLMCGMTYRQISLIQRLCIASYFGAFQAGMPCIGYFLGCLFYQIIASIDHYVAFCLLCFIGYSMIKESFQQRNQSFSISLLDMTIYGLATSVDAMVIGVTFAFFEVNMMIAALTIGLITMILCFIGLYIGYLIGQKFQNKAIFLGGIVLILLAFKVLITM